MKHFVWLITGILVSVAILTLFAGGLENAGFMILVSIVCTAGISLIAWIPAWLAIGCLTCKLILLVGGPDLAGERLEPAAKEQTIGERADLELTNYITYAVRQGMPRDQIQVILSDAGWSENDINQAWPSRKSTD